MSTSQAPHPADGEQPTDERALHSGSTNVQAAAAHQTLQLTGSTAGQAGDLDSHLLGVFADCMEDDEEEALFASAAAGAERPTPYTADGFQSAAQMLENLGQREPSGGLLGSDSTPRPGPDHAARRVSTLSGWPNTRVTATEDAAMPQHPAAGHDEDGPQALEVVFADEDTCAAVPWDAGARSTAEHADRMDGDRASQEASMQDAAGAGRAHDISRAFDLLDIIDYAEDVEAQQGSFQHSPHSRSQSQGARPTCSHGAQMEDDTLVYMDEDVQMKGHDREPHESRAHADVAAPTAGGRLDGSAEQQHIPLSEQAAMEEDKLVSEDDQIVYADEDHAGDLVVMGSLASSERHTLYTDSSPVWTKQPAPPSPAGAPGSCGEAQPGQPATVQEGGGEAGSHAPPQQPAQRKRKKDELRDAMIQVEDLWCHSCSCPLLMPGQGSLANQKLRCAQDLLQERGRSRLLEPLVGCMAREVEAELHQAGSVRLSHLQDACRRAGLDRGATPQVMHCLQSPLHVHGAPLQDGVTCRLLLSLQRHLYALLTLVQRNNSCGGSAPQLRLEPVDARADVIVKMA